MSKQVILITGSSTGFGRRSAEDLARRGHTVYASMRGTEGKNKEHADALKELASQESIGLKVIELDVTDEASVAAAAQQIQEEAGRIDVIVNNAGQFVSGIVETFPTDQMQQLFDVNVYGPHRVVRQLAPLMRAGGGGLIINITSTVGRIAFPFIGVYNASKFALEALGEAYRHEFENQGIDVVNLAPGAFPTEIFGKVAQGRDESRLEPYGDELGQMEAFFGGLGEALEQPDAPSPQLIVDAIRELIDTPSGERPFRLTVGTAGTAGVRELNQDYDRRKAEAMAAFGA